MRGGIRIAALALVVVAAGCSSSKPSASSSATPGLSGSAGPSHSARPSPSPKPGPVKLVSEVTPVGDILSTGSGRTVYAFSLDSAHHSACRNPCASVWPALTYTKLTLGAGVAQSKVGVVIRPDGDKQVTYGGHPLYVYTGDTSAQEINGDGITSYGGTWHAVLVSGATVSSSAAPGSGGFY